MARVPKVQQPADAAMMIASQQTRLRQVEATIGAGGGGSGGAQLYSIFQTYSATAAPVFLRSSQVSAADLVFRRDFIPSTAAGADSWMGSIDLAAHAVVDDIEAMATVSYGVKVALVGRVKNDQLALPTGVGPAAAGGFPDPAGVLKPIGPSARLPLWSDPFATHGELIVQGAYNSSWYPSDWADTPEPGDIDISIILYSGFPNPGTAVAFYSSAVYTGYALERTVSGGVGGGGGGGGAPSSKTGRGDVALDLQSTGLPGPSTMKYSATKRGVVGAYEATAEVDAHFAMILQDPGVDQEVGIIPGSVVVDGEVFFLRPYIVGAPGVPRWSAPVYPGTYGSASIPRPIGLIVAYPSGIFYAPFADTPAGEATSAHAWIHYTASPDFGSSSVVTG